MLGEREGVLLGREGVFIVGFLLVEIFFIYSIMFLFFRLSVSSLVLCEGGGRLSSASEGGGRGDVGGLIEVLVDGLFVEQGCEEWGAGSMAFAS